MGDSKLRIFIQIPSYSVLVLFGLMCGFVQKFVP